MKFLFIGVYANQDDIINLNKLSKTDANMSVAAMKYTRLIGEGLKHNVGDNSTNLFLVPIGMYPACKLFLWNKREADGNHYIPFINIILLKQLTISLYLFYFSIKWYLKNSREEKKVVVFSFIYLPFLIAVAPLKFFKNFYITTFVPDMPEYEFSYSKTSFSLKSFLVPIYIWLCRKVISITDYFVFITKYMVDFYPKRPYSITEGFTDSKINDELIIEYSNKNAIMYAGALFEKFGVKLLINTFIKLKGDYELWLFGSGDMEAEVIKTAKKDPRIKYFGNRPNEEVLSYEKKAKLLINPRFSDNEFTKFSFPSKLMEYMASGTPVLTTKLPGIPDDYLDKMFYIESETKEGFEQSILDCLSKSQKELDVFGESAKSYVLQEKNNFMQIKKILESMNYELTK